jgi:hypothetical protein
VRGKVSAKAVGLFTYEKALDANGSAAPCEVKVYPLLVSRQTETFPESEQRIAQWVDPDRAASLVKEPELKTLIATFAKRIAKAAAKLPA